MKTIYLPVYHHAGSHCQAEVHENCLQSFMKVASL